MKDNEIEFQYWMRPMRQMVLVRFEGRVYQIHGERIVLYPINVMAAALWRDREAIVRWEQEGKWPKPKWKLDDKRTKRWYSKAQILEAHRIHWQLCEGDYGYSHSRHFDLEEFFKRVKATFHRVDGEFVKRVKANAAG